MYNLVYTQCLFGRERERFVSASGWMNGWMDMVKKGARPLVMGMDCTNHQGIVHTTDRSGTGAGMGWVGQGYREDEAHVKNGFGSCHVGSSFSLCVLELVFNLW